jgi:plastocyanin
MMKKLLLILFIVSSFNSKGTIHQIQVWNGYYQFLPPNNITVQLGDTVQWIPLDPPTMTHTITSDNIPAGAASFNQIWQLPADTFFQYIPQVAGLYQYVCTPHIPMGMIGEFTVVNGSATQTYVPDDNFEAYLEANGMGNGIANDDYVTTSNINTVTFLDVSFGSISDLTGIEDFTSVQALWCDYNDLTTLDLSNNTALVELYCGYNELTSLNINSLTSLDNLRCEKNQLTSLDVSIATSLTDLKCGSNQLTSLNVSNNTALTRLYCDSNQLTSLDLRNGNNINMGGGSFFTSFSTNANPQLYCINVDDVSWSTANWTVYDENIDSHHYFSTNCPPLSVIQEQTTNKELLKVTDILGREVNEKRNTPLFYIYDDGTVEKKIIIE